MAGPTGPGCPVCGEPVSPLAVTCEECGYTLGAVGDPSPVNDRPTAPVEDRQAPTGGDGTREATGPCRRCGGELPAGARFCKHCGHEVREWRLVPVLLMILGFCLTASIIGAVVGVPMQVLALRLFREARDGTVVAD